MPPDARWIFHAFFVGSKVGAIMLRKVWSNHSSILFTTRRKWAHATDHQFTV